MKTEFFVAMGIVLAIALLFSFQNKSIEQQKSELISHGKYKCCIEKPCNYCLIKYQECDCMDEVVNGESPCGECIGEILEGEGNPYLAEYFARSIAKEIGSKYLEMLKQIIFEKYGKPVEEQL